VDALGNNGNVSMPEQVSRPNPWRKMMTMNSYSRVLYKNLLKSQVIKDFFCFVYQEITFTCSRATRVIVLSQIDPVHTNRYGRFL